MPEKEYIEREAIEKAFAEEISTNYLDDYAKGFQAALLAVMSIPTADVAPVRHGYWVEQENWATDDYYYTCSACGEDYNTIDGTPDYNFCPNCGAKMDGGVKRNEQSGFNQHTAEMV